MADTMKMEYKIFLEAEDVSQSRILSCASYMKHVLESCNNLYISRAELDDESDLDDFVLRLFVEEEIEEKECTNPALVLASLRRATRSAPSCTRSSTP